MTPTYALPPEWAIAIREDAESYLGDVARVRAGILKHISEPHHVSLRVGRIYPQASSWHNRDWANHQKINTAWVTSRPRCQDCGRLINHGDKAIRYRYHRLPGTFGRTRFIHKECPE